MPKMAATPIFGKNLLLMCLGENGITYGSLEIVKDFGLKHGIDCQLNEDMIFRSAVFKENVEVLS